MSFGYMNIKTFLVERSNLILRNALKGKISYEKFKEWSWLAQCEGFDSLKDWIRKELVLTEYELEIRRRINNV